MREWKWEREWRLPHVLGWTRSELEKHYQQAGVIVLVVPSLVRLPLLSHAVSYMCG